MTDTVDNTPDSIPDTASNADLVAQAVEQSQDKPEDKADFSFVLDKYKAEGKTDEQAAFEQAKAYTELQSKFGAFTGAPEEYEVKLSDAMSEQINLDDYKDDPLFQDFKGLAKEMGINNEGFNQLTEMYFKSHLADVEALETIRTEEMKALGDNAERRLTNIQDWARYNLDAETGKALGDMLNSASSVQALESIIAKTRNAPQVKEVESSPAISRDELSKMINAKDEFGAPMMNKKEYRDKVNKLYAQVVGEGEQHVVVGG